MSPRAVDDSRRVLSARLDRRALERLVRLDVTLEALLAFALANDREDAVAILARRAADLRGDLARIQATSHVEERHWEEDDPVAGALAKAAEAFKTGVVWIDQRERTVSLGASPVELGPILREKLFDRVPSVVCTSATLATDVGRPSCHFTKSRIGADDTAESSWRRRSTSRPAPSCTSAEDAGGRPSTASGRMRGPCRRPSRHHRGGAS